MTNVEREIRDCYKRMNHELATREGFGSSQWSANSQYGVTLSLHETQELAEQAALDYYSERMNLIRQ